MAEIFYSCNTTSSRLIVILASTPSAPDPELNPGKPGGPPIIAAPVPLNTPPYPLILLALYCACI